MDEAKSRRRLMAWVGVGLLLAGATVAAGVSVGAGAAWGLGAILATVYSGTFAFIEHTPVKKNQAGTALAQTNPAIPRPESPGVRMPEPADAPEPEADHQAASGDVSSSAPAPAFPAWPRTAGNAHLFWHPALNRMEDVLAAQITDPSTIIGIAERVGIGAASLSPGRGSPTNYWHEVLRRAWMTGGEGKTYEVLRQANDVAESRAISGLMDTYRQGHR